MKTKQLFLKAIICVILFMMTTSVMAQFTATGVVTELNGDPVVGASVVIKNTTTGTTTDFDGKYSLKVPGESAVLIYTFIGFQSTERTVSKAANRMDVMIQESIIDIDEVVISGLATNVKRSNLANSVESISAEKLMGVAPAATFDALQGKFKGANITATSGAPGGGIRVDMRGVTSINGKAQPLYIIDGVYIDNSTIAGGLDLVSNASGGGSSDPFNQDNPTNRIADLDPEDIESVEILKGASAAAIYGSRAAGGVVLITTKRGKSMGEKHLGVNVSQTFGIAKILNPLGVRDWTVERVNAAFGVDSTGKGLQEDAFLAAQAAGELNDYEDELYGNTGFLTNTRLSITGGNEKTSFYAGTTVKREKGIVEHTGYNKTSFRLNVDHELAKWLDIAISNNYILSKADRGFFNNDNTGTTMGISLLSTPAWADLHPDELGNYPNNPFAASNFLQTGALMTNQETVNRYIGGASLTAKLFANDNHSLRLIGRAGIDRYTFNTEAIFPQTLQFQSNGNGTNGASIQGNTINFNNNISGFLVHTYSPDDEKFSLRTQFGVTREDFNQNTILVYATDLIGSQTNVDQAGSKDTYQNRIEQKDRGFFVQEEVNYSDQILFTIGLRGDKSSNNGDVNKMFFYPKASFAINLHEFGFWEFDNPNQFKVRAAFGQSGNFAEFGSKFTSFTSTNIGGIAGSLINTTRGNAGVEPERQTEIEGGIDMSFLDGNLGFDITYYNKQVKDLLLEVNVPTSAGFVDQVTNAADLRNQGVEIGLNAQIFAKRAFNWTSETAFWLNRSEVTRLDVPAFNIGAFGATLGSFRIEEGKSATQIVGIGPDPDENGIQVYGDAEPDFQMSFRNTMSYKGFDLSFLFHWKHGGEGVNLTTLLSDIFGTSPDFDDTNLDPTGAMDNGNFRLNALGSTAEPWVEKTGFVRLREIGLYYNVPSKALESAFRERVQNIRIGISAYNALNFFDYNSYDPEVSNFVGAGISKGVEVAPFPSSKRFNFHLNVGF